MSNLMAPTADELRRKKTQGVVDYIENGAENYRDGDMYSQSQGQIVGDNTFKELTQEDWDRHNRWLKSLTEPTQAEIDSKKKWDAEQAAKKKTLVDYKDAGKADSIDYDSYWRDMTPKKMTEIKNNNPQLARKLMQYGSSLEGRYYYKQYRSVWPLFNKD